MTEKGQKLEKKHKEWHIRKKKPRKNATLNRKFFENSNPNPDFPIFRLVAAIAPGGFSRSSKAKAAAEAQQTKTAPEAAQNGGNTPLLMTPGGSANNSM